MWRVFFIQQYGIGNQAEDRARVHGATAAAMPTKRKRRPNELEPAPLRMVAGAGFEPATFGL